ncbi:glycosyltransferase family 2 protein [Opitutus sp. GAS368]|uniref:glycosyltransferase family 2 protein n=1 Tax=Opitutus sp. GAS368 TaxID=1882749 RepID=UPI00087C5A4E|nr:glycosyltransferase family 2 protein [Opitutus sp. GAS368]SDS41735.1 Glycosyl transferase family 2 [Opitutus sp. GAS368]
MKVIASASAAWVSLGMIARNEEKAIGPALESLFRQSLFAELEQRGLAAEIWCVANDCTDATVEVAGRILAHHGAGHPHRHVFTARVLTVPEAGKINAWNLFVHRVSAADARYLILMDADIRFGHVTTLWNLCRALEEDSFAQISAGEPVKDLALKKDPSLRERISLATSRLTQGSAAQLTGQLYCIRAATARRVRLPRELPACEDGLIKSLVCTDSLTKEPQPARVVRARHASHIFEAYVSIGAILRNQKRQMIGQTFVHLLIDRYLPALPAAARADLNRTVQRLDEEDPAWLRRLVAEHLRRTRWFWRLFPGILSFRFRRLARLPVAKRLRHLPATLIGFGVTLAACWLAARALRRGRLRYWPDKRQPPGRPDGPVGLVRPVLPG